LSFIVAACGKLISRIQGGCQLSTLPYLFLEVEIKALEIFLKKNMGEF